MPESSSARFKISRIRIQYLGIYSAELSCCLAANAPTTFAWNISKDTLRRPRIFDRDLPVAGHILKPGNSNGCVVVTMVDDIMSLKSSTYPRPPAKSTKSLTGLKSMEGIEPMACPHAKGGQNTVVFGAEVDDTATIS